VSARGAGRRPRHHGIALLVLLYMFLPIFVVVLMSFNDPRAEAVYEFDGVHAGQLAHPCAPTACARRWHSMQIGFWPPGAPRARAR
jgi:spermidine/putrescine transport system permease protein